MVYSRTELYFCTMTSTYGGTIDRVADSDNGYSSGSFECIDGYESEDMFAKNSESEIEPKFWQISLWTGNGWLSSRDSEHKADSSNSTRVTNKQSGNV